MENGSWVVVLLLPLLSIVLLALATSTFSLRYLQEKWRETLRWRRACFDKEDCEFGFGAEAQRWCVCGDYVQHQLRRSGYCDDYLFLN